MSAIRLPSRLPATIAEALDHVVAVDPGRTALRAPSGTLSYKQLDAAANAAAAQLAAIGVKRGDRVAATLPNDIDIVVAFHGAMRLGAIWLGINRPLAIPEKCAVLASARPAVLLADPASAAELGTAIGAATVMTVDPSDPHDQWRAGLRALAAAGRPDPPDAGAPAAIAYTSGTTGLPSGIVHSQRALLLPAASIVASRNYGVELHKGDCLPLTILNMMILTTLLTAAAGGCCVVSDRRDARGIAEWIGRESITVWNGVPALLHTMVTDDSIDPDWLSTLSEVWTGGADCPEELIAAFVARFAVPIRSTYGLTEAPSVVAIDPIDAPHTAGASGVPLPHLDVVVRDEHGEPLPADRQGEICVRATEDGEWKSTYEPMLGFWRDNRLEPFDRDELRTGDIGWLDGGGRIVVRDRKKLLIIRGGANVYPAEVERVLCAVPGVRAAAVLGVPDARLGQRVVAAVEADTAEGPVPEDLVAHCSAQLARYKVPERIVVVDELPRNSMGKLRRAVVSEMFL